MTPMLQYAYIKKMHVNTSKWLTKVGMGPKEVHKNHS